MVLAQHYGPLLALPFLGGVAVGWFTSRGRPSRAGWAGIAAGGAVLVAALGASALAVVPGAAGLYLDTALVFVLAYLGGCAIGLLLRVVYLPREASAGESG